jgi:hypothetical protein
MTRIGRYQIKSRQLCWQCFLPARQPRPAQNFPTKLRRSIPVCRHRLAALLECIPERHLLHKAFLKSPFRLTTRDCSTPMAFAWNTGSTPGASKTFQPHLCGLPYGASEYLTIPRKAQSKTICLLRNRWNTLRRRILQFWLATP